MNRYRLPVFFTQFLPHLTLTALLYVYPDSISALNANYLKYVLALVTFLNSFNRLTLTKLSLVFPVSYCKHVLMKFLRQRNIHPTLLKVRRYLLVRWGSTMSSKFSGFWLSVTTIIPIVISASFFGCFDHSASASTGHSTNSYGLTSKSAGFSSVVTQDHTPPTAVISSTRLATNTPPSLWSLIDPS